MRSISILTVWLAIVATDQQGTAQQVDPSGLRERLAELDVNADRVLERDEVPEAGRAAFDRLLKRGDSNQNGKLEADELRALAEQASLAEKPAAAAGERFRAMDKDGDGKVSKAEFTGPAALFDRLDSDQDGVISRQDFLAFAQTQRRAAAAKPTAKPAAKAKESSEKSESESKKTATTPPRSAAPVAAENRFKAMDKNSDGKLDRTEFPRKNVFNRLDADNDGFLSLSEWTALARSK
jgi:Ca2+-binding EF-hand superfamily protein